MLNAAGKMTDVESGVVIQVVGRKLPFGFGGVSLAHDRHFIAVDEAVLVRVVFRQDQRVG